MKVIIDTSSLLSFIRYYLPFDKKGTLFDFVKKELEDGNILLIDAVYNECEYISKGLVLKTLNYLRIPEFKKKFKLPVRTNNLIPPSPKKFYNLLNNNFRTPLSRKLGEAEFEEQKKEFLQTADARMIILALIKRHNKEDIAIVTEETAIGNDNKSFKKIPAICKILDIQVITFPEFIKNYLEINFSVKHS